MPAHSYEEIRRAAIEILAGREPTRFMPPETRQFLTFMAAVAEVLYRWDGGAEPANRHWQPDMVGEDRETFREMFWDLFREGIITLGLNDSNATYPFFRPTQHGQGQKLVQLQGQYFFHDVASYERLIKADAPNIDPATLVYLKEAMQAFKAGCVLASTVMLGVAAEHTFSLVLDAALSNPKYQKIFEKANKGKWISDKLEEFKKAMDSKMAVHLDPKTSEGLDAMFNHVQEFIKDFRNKAGHPTGTVLSRDLVFVLLALFIPYVKKAYQLKTFFETT